MSDELKALADSLRPDNRPERLQGALNRGLTFDPDAYAKAVKVSAQTGVVPTAVLRDQRAFDRRMPVDPAEFVNMSPKTADWLLGNDDYAAQAHDDLDTLAKFERAAKDVGSQILQIPQRAMGGLFRGIGGVFSLEGAIMTEALKPDGSAWAKALAFGMNPGALPGNAELATQVGKDVREYYEPIFTDPALTPSTTSGEVAGFVGNLAGTMGKAVLAGPGAPLLFGAEALGEGGGSALERGATPGQATVKAVGSGTLNTALAFIPGGKFGSGQNLARAFEEGGKLAIAKEVGKGLTARAIRGTTLGTGVTATENLLSRTYDPKTPLLEGLGANVASFIGLEGAGYLSHAVKLSAASKLKVRAPEVFQSAAEAILKESGAEEVMIPAERFQTFFQTEGMDPAKVAEQVGAKNYTEALAAGTDVVVPTAGALAKLSDPHLQGLLPDMRLKSDIMTPREAAEHVIGAPDRVAKMVEEAKATLPDAEFQAFSEIKAEVQKRLEETGRFSRALAEDNAVLMARGLVNQGLREGLDPLKVFEGYGLNITGPGDAKMVGMTLEQPGDRRGSITFGEKNKVSISLLEKADASTFVHELGHFWLKMQSDLAQRPEATEQVKADLAVILKWMGLESPDQIGTKQHEQFARAHEAFLREGNTPSPELATTFARFKTWLSAIYRRLKSLNVNLTDDVRGVFDRIYATDAEIQAARERLGGDKPLFESAEKAGMSEAEFKEYQTLAGREREGAKASLDARLQAEADRTKLQWWKDEVAKAKEEVAPQVDSDPAQRAFRVLTEGRLEDGAPIKLSKDELVRQFGAEALKELPRNGAKWVYAKEGGMDAEAAAELLGFTSGKKLMDTLRGVRPREEQIQAEAERVMRDRHGDLLQNGSLAEAALESVFNEPREARLLMELRAFRKKAAAAAEGKKEARATVKEVPHIQVFRNAAKEIVGETPVRMLDPWRYLQASRKASRESFEAMAKDQFTAAGDAKQKEILNHHLFLEASKAKKEATAVFAYVREGEGKAVQGMLGRAGGDFQEQWNALASRYEFRKVTNRALDQRTQSLAEWVRVNAEDGAQIDSSLLVEGQTKNWREVSVTELRAVRDALVNIETVARHQLGMELAGQRLDYEREIGEFEQRAREVNTSKATARRGSKLSMGEETASSLQGFNAYMQKMEWFIDQLDGGDINGPARRNIKKPIDDAAGREKVMLSEVKSKLVDVLKTMTKEDRVREFDSVDVTFPKMDRPMNRMQLFSWALNLGTEENRKVAILGEGLLNGDGSLRPEFGEALGKLTLKECERLQGIWDALESMRPEIIAKERRVTGLEPKWKNVTPLTVHTADGHTVNLRGGYYPLKADTEVSNIGKRQMNPTIQEGTFNRPTVSTSHTETVTGATYPLLLDYPTVLSQHIPAVIKNVTAGEAISYVSKFIMNDQVSGTIRETLGPAKEKEFLPWLQSFATNGVDNSQGGPIMRWFMARRLGVVAAKLGGNLTSYAVQVTDGLKPLTEVSPKYLVQAFYDIRRNPAEVIAEIKRLSPNEMRFREENFNREIRDMLQSKPMLEASRHQLTEFLMTGFTVMDRLTSNPAWLAKYREGMATHGKEAQAVMEADRLIARTMQ